jgi:bacteriocin biosynthesis cyclodehydratase domain-containing protein
MVTELVRTLYDRDFARDVKPGEDTASLPAPVARRFAAQLAYIDHYVGTPGARFERFRNARVAVVGDDSVARWCVMSLIRNGAAGVAVLPTIGTPQNDFEDVLAEAAALTADGCPCAISYLAGDNGPLGWAQLADYDMVLVTGTADVARRILPLLEAGIPQGCKLLAAWAYGAHAVIGPLMEPGKPGCWACAVLRLGANGDRGDAADLWSGAALGGVGDPAAALSGPLAGMVGNLLAYEVFRGATGALRAETGGAILIQDLDSLDARSEPLLPHPACPFCAPATATTNVVATNSASATSATMRRPAVTGTVATDTAPTTTASTDATSISTTSISTASAGGASTSAATEAATQPIDVPDLGEVRGPRGEGEDLLDDPADVLRELESRSVLVHPRAGVFSGYGDDDWNQIPLKIGTVRLGIGHGARREISAFDVHHVAGARISALYAAAEVYTDHVIPVGRVLSGDGLERSRLRWPIVEPERLALASGTAVRADQVAHWAAVTRFGRDETVLVPAAALRTFGPYNRQRIVLASSAGTAAGDSPGHAIARGLQSALGLDALTRALRGTATVAAVPLDALATDRELAFLAKSARNLGVDVELLDLGDCEQRPAPVLLARVRGTAEGAGEWALGCAPGWQEAAVVALRDLLGRIQLGRQTSADQDIDCGDRILSDLDADALAATSEAGPQLDAVTPWTEVVRRVRTSGCDILVAPVDAPDLGAGRISAARVLLMRTGDDPR